jgi:hypothetical protein
MKSKMPCEPGPAPLMKLAQATGKAKASLTKARARSLSPRSAAQLARPTISSEAEGQNLTSAFLKRGAARPTRSPKFRSQSFLLESLDVA